MSMPTPETIIAKKEVFQKTFCEYLIEKIEEKYRIATRRGPAGASLANQITAAAINTFGLIAVTALSVTAAVVSGPMAPAIAAAIAGFVLPTLSGAVGEAGLWVAERNADGVTSNLNDERMAFVIWETSRRLVKIYEYQIACLRTDFDIQKMAAAAVERIINYAESDKGQKQAFTCESLLWGVLRGKCSKLSVREYLKKPELNTISGLESGWNISSIFEGPGLRGSDGEFKKHSKNNLDKAGKYGFREPIDEMDELDYVVEILNPEETKHSAYVPLTCFVTQNDLQSYMDVVNNPSLAIKESLNQFIARLRGLPPETKTIYKDNKINISLARGIFIGSDFSNVDMEGIDLSEANFSDAYCLHSKLKNTVCKNTVWQRCHLEASDMSHANLEDADLSGATLTYTILKDVTVNSYTNLRNINAIGLLIDPDKLTVAKTDSNINNFLEKLYEQRLEEQSKTSNVVKQSQTTTNILGIYAEPIKAIDYFSRQIDSILKNQFCSNRVVILIGVEGVGKTAIAEHYARQFLINLPETKYMRLVWKFDASNDLKAQMIKLGIKLGINPEAHYQKFKEFMEQILTDPSTVALLLFDNAESYATLEEYLPKEECLINTQIIILSRTESDFLQHHHSILQINGCTEEESLDFLSEYKASAGLCQQTELQVLNKIGNYFGGLPLGLTNARSYLELTHEAPEKYLELLRNFDEQYERINETNFSTRCKRAAIISAAIVSETLHGFDRELLSTLIFLDPQKIDIDFFKKHFCQNFTRLNFIIARLKQCQLIWIQGVGESRKLQINSFNLEFIQEYSLISELEVPLDNVLKILNSMFNKNTLTFENHQHNLALLPHVEALLNKIKNFPQLLNGNSTDKIMFQLIPLLDATAYFYTQIGKSMEKHSLVWFEQAKKYCIKLAYENDEKEIELIDECLAKSTLTSSLEKELFISLATNLDEKLSQKSPKLSEYYASILYSYGRMYFYSRNLDETTQRKLIGAIKLAYWLCITIENRVGKKLLHTILTETNGLLYLALEARADKTSLLHVENRYLELLNKTEGAYYDITAGEDVNVSTKDILVHINPTLDEGNGHIKIQLKEYSVNKRHFSVCYSQLAKAYQRLGQFSVIEKNTTKAKSYYKKAAGHANAAFEPPMFYDDLTLPSSSSAFFSSYLKTFEREAVYYNIRGNILVDEKNPEGDVSKAKDDFEKAHDIEKSKNNGKGKRDYPLADALYGLALCYLRPGVTHDLDKAKEKSQECFSILSEIYPAEDPRLNEIKDLQSQVEEQVSIHNIRP